MKKEELYLFAAFSGFNNKTKKKITEESADWQNSSVPSPDFLSLPFVTEKQREKWKEYRNDMPARREEFRKMTDRGISFMAFPEEDYPASFRQIDDPPFFITVRGALPAKQLPKAAVVGARACSEYGREMASFFAAELSKNGVGIVSGMAYGVDAAAHRGALREGGMTAAVLGNGVDICYPKENFDIYQSMTERGCILSEFLPGEKPAAWHFPLRNRLISALSDCVLVIEAKENSGSLITVDHALEQGKDVFALPGRISDPLSKGCNKLIQNGAAPLLDTEDVLDYLKNRVHFQESSLKKSDLILADDEKRVYSCLDFFPKHMESLLAETEFSLAKLTKVLLTLEQKGAVIRVTDGTFCRKARKDGTE